MASFENSRPVTDGRLLGGLTGSFFSGLIGTFSAWNDTRVTRNALSRLSDHELNDLGLTRSDIHNMSSPLRR